MIIGEWSVDDAGKIRHLLCTHVSSWSHTHRCWVANPGYDMGGHYIQVNAPAMVVEIAKNQYQIWSDSREPYRGKV